MTFLITLLACNNPDYLKLCASDDECPGGLTCLAASEPLDTGDATRLVCTYACEADADCPIQSECGGTGDQRRSECVDGVCSARVCD